MSVFSKLSTSKKQAQKIEDGGKQKEKADAVPKPKYHHKPQHAYVDALNSGSTPNPSNSREVLREAVERRKSRLAQNDSQLIMNGLHTAHSSGTAITTMSSWEARKAMAQKDQFQKTSTFGSARKSYQSSPLASVEPSTRAPSSVSSYDQLEMARLQPSPLKPSLKRSSSSYKKSVTIQAPSHESSPRSPTFGDKLGSPYVTIIPSPYSSMPKTVDVKSTEVPADLSSSDEGGKKPVAKKARKRLTMFWKRRSPPLAVAAA